MKTVNLKIKCCSECPFCESEREYTPDSWEYCFSWKCSKKGNKVIAILDFFEKNLK